MARPSTFTLEQLVDGFNSVPQEWMAMRHLETHFSAGRPTISRRLGEGIAAGLFEARGKGPSRQYRLTATGRLGVAPPAGRVGQGTAAGPAWSSQAADLLAYVRGPRASRKPVSYQETLVGNYQPNQTFWLPASLRIKLAELGRVSGERPAGTYARDILGQLLIDLSWESSRLEGNRYSRLETKELIEAGLEAPGKTRQEAVMILNHKKAIEFLVEIAPYDDPWNRVIANVHTLLMDGLLRNEEGLGTIRERIVTIEGSVYTPWQEPQKLGRMYRTVCDVGQAIEDPIEAAFFLFTQIPYLQPFEDGNKRTSRVSCNLPLAKANYAPLAFMDVEESDYYGALLGLYETADPCVARDLFEWAYERSVQSYRAVKESMREPDPFRVRLRAALSEAVRAVVADNKTIEAAITTLRLSAMDVAPFRTMLQNEISRLSEYNYARYGLKYSQLEEWLMRAQEQA